jgi:hypothetical protein
VITWQPGDPLPPWTDRRQGERRGHGRPHTETTGDDWIMFVIYAIALAAVITAAALSLL